MRIEAQGLIFDAVGRPKSEAISYFTSLCPLSSGAILAGFQNGPSKHSPHSTIRLCRSDDGADTWREVAWRFETLLEGIPGSLAAAEIVEPEPGRLLLFTTWFDRSDPNRPLFDPDTEGLLRSRQLVCVSTDEGESWSPWRELSTGDLTGCAGTGCVVHWEDGALAFPFESFKEFDDPRPVRPGAWLLVSRDGGQAFETPFSVAQHPDDRIYYWDQRLCPAGPTGEFVALFWTHDRAARQDLRVHLLHGDLRRPRTETPLPRETTIPGQIAAPLLLPDGRLLAFVVDRGRPGTLKLWVSHDNGQSWPEAETLLIHRHEERAALTQGATDIDFAQYWEDMGRWSFGHPAIRRLDESHILLAYYAGDPDRMSIHWARVFIGGAE
ncbi:MAG: sialidase family protein [Actinomycetota bacterium]